MNMSHCRFTNTLLDLKDAYEHMDDDLETLSSEERKARLSLLKLCARIADDFEYEIEAQS